MAVNEGSRKLKAVVTELALLESLLHSPSKKFTQGFLKIAGEEYKKKFEVSMLRGMSPDGRPHEPLAVASKFPKKKYRNPFNVPLINSYALFKSFWTKLKLGSVEIGTSHPYASALHKGGTRTDDPVRLNRFHRSDYKGERTLPPRTIVEISREAQKTIARRFEAWAMSQITLTGSKAPMATALIRMFVSRVGGMK